MIINRSHIPWFLGVVVASALAALLYTANFHPGQYTNFQLPKVFGPTPPVVKTVGGTPLGLLFGTIAYLTFLIAAGLGIRKKRRLWPIGHVQLWMKAHIWLTILSIPLILFHSGFHLGGGWTTLLMVLYTIVMASGFYGLFLQQYMPGFIARRLPQEAVFEAIPHVQDRLLEGADRLWKELNPATPRPTHGHHGDHHGGQGTAVLTDEEEKEEHSRKSMAQFMQEQVFPYLRAASGRGHRLSVPHVAADLFRALRDNCTSKWAPQARLIEQWCYDRSLLDQQVRLHHWLHLWLLVHVPMSIILLVFTLWHAIRLVSYL